MLLWLSFFFLPSTGSSKMITYTNLPTAQLTFYALAEVQASGKVITLKRSFRPGLNRICTNKAGVIGYKLY